MVAEAIANPPVPRRRSGWSTARTTYFRLVVALTLTVAIASFVRDRGQLLSNISFWLFLVPFVVTLWRAEAGFLAAILLLTVTPSLHEQSNALAGANLHAWAYPAVDCCLGFLAAWTLKGGLRGVDNCLNRFPSGPLLLFHAWVVLSAVIAVGQKHLAERLGIVAARLGLQRMANPRHQLARRLLPVTGSILLQRRSGDVVRQRGRSCVTEVSGF